VLLVEDNSVNMKVCAYPRAGNFAADDMDSDPYELYEAGQRRIHHGDQRPRGFA
jgi:hypothetical protein